MSYLFTMLSMRCFPLVHCALFAQISANGNTRIWSCCTFHWVASHKPKFSSRISNWQLGTSSASSNSDATWQFWCQMLLLEVATSQHKNILMYSVTREFLTCRQARLHAIVLCVRSATVIHINSPTQAKAGRFCFHCLRCIMVLEGSARRCEQYRAINSIYSTSLTQCRDIGCEVSCVRLFGILVGSGSSWTDDFHVAFRLRQWRHACHKENFAKSKPENWARWLLQCCFVSWCLHNRTSRLAMLWLADKISSRFVIATSGPWLGESPLGFPVGFRARWKPAQPWLIRQKQKRHLPHQRHRRPPGDCMASSQMSLSWIIWSTTCGLPQ